METEMNQILFALLRSSICGEELSGEERALFSRESLPELITLAKQHDMLHLLIWGLKRNGLLTPADAPLENSIFKAAYRYEQTNYEYGALCGALEKAEIPFLPLKGSVLRAYYPEAWMRTSCDIDILVHETDLERAITLLTDTCEYEFQGKGPHDVSLFSPTRVHVELHYTLMEDGRVNASSGILSSVWEYTSPRSGSTYWREMCDEMFYFYHIAHMAKHFETGGCGIKPFVDLWILDRLEGIDQSSRDELLARGDLLKFAESVRALSRIWFEGAEMDPISKQIEQYILLGGVYGIEENKIAVQQQKKGGWFRYTLSKIFVPYDELKFVYPILEKHRWLLPLMEIRRWGRLIFCGHTKRVVRELKHNRDISSEKGDMTSRFLSDIGL